MKTTSNLRRGSWSESIAGVVSGLLLLGLSQSDAAAGSVPTLSVANADCKGVASWPAAMGESLAQMFVTELNQLPNFRVLDAGAAGSASAGKGADYTFKSTVTTFGVTQTNLGTAVAGLPLPRFLSKIGLDQTETTLQIAWHIQDNATGEWITGASGRADVVVKGGGIKLDTGKGIGSINLNASQQKAMLKAVTEIVAKVGKLELSPSARLASNEPANSGSARKEKGMVKAVTGEEVWVSLGANNGFKKGDKVKIYKPVEKKNKKGEVIALTYEPVVEITLAKVQKDMGMGLNTGSAAISEDWIAADAAMDADSLN